MIAAANRKKPSPARASTKVVSCSQRAGLLCLASSEVTGTCSRTPRPLAPFRAAMVRTRSRPPSLVTVPPRLAVLLPVAPPLRAALPLLAAPLLAAPLLAAPLLAAPLLAAPLLAAPLLAAPLLAAPLLAAPLLAAPLLAAPLLAAP